MAKVKDWIRWAMRRNGPKDVLRHKLAGDDPTAGYVGPPRDLHEIIVDELPLFSIRTARLMLRDPVVCIGMSTRNAALMPAQIKVKCDHPGVREFIGKTWRFLWGRHASKFLRAKAYGFQGLQMEFSVDKTTGMLNVCGVKEFSPHDQRPLIHDGRVVGFRVLPSRGSRRYHGQSFRLFAPRALWLTFDEQAGNYLGQPLLKRSYAPWYEKHMPHGALKTRQLRLFKDAYIGDVFKYPFNRSIELASGEQIPWRDVLRGIAEARMSGATMVIPNIVDPQSGQSLIEYTPPQDTGDPKAIFQWVDDSDRDIWRGLDVFEEVIQAAEVGSGFSGRSIPLVMFLSACQNEFIDLVECTLTQVIDPLVWFNFGEVQYEVETVPLVETFSDDMSGDAMGGGAMGGNVNGGQSPQKQQPPQEQQQSQQQQKPKKTPVQFAEFRPYEIAEFQPVDYGRSDEIAAHGLEALQQVMALSSGQVWREVRRQMPQRKGRKALFGYAAGALVLAAVVKLLKDKRKEAQEIVEDMLMESAAAGAAVAQETITRDVTSVKADSVRSAAPPTDPVIVAPAPEQTPQPQGDLPAPILPPVAPAVPPAPPSQPPGDAPTTEDMFGRPRRVRFPDEESARQAMRDATALAGPDYRTTAELVKRDAFAITTQMSDEVVAQIREALEENMEQGMGLAAFVQRVQEIQAGEDYPLSRAHIELVFRANTASYLSNAADRSLRNPLIADQFPYRAYSATHDDRVRATHLALETLGLNGTNVYRGDDPAWEAFRPPWDYNCRCAWRPVNVRQAARAGVVEANVWLGRAQQLAEERGGLAEEYLRETAPAQPQHVPWPSVGGVPFYPSPEWMRQGVQFGEVSSSATEAAQATRKPTAAQAESGNYRKGKFRIHGLLVTIETPKGAKRRPEWPALKHHYGYINRTEGVDGDHVDVFIGPQVKSEFVYVVDQVDEAGNFDEHKVMLGFTSKRKARAAYLANYTKDWTCGPITRMSVDEFKEWLASRDSKSMASAAQFAESATLERPRATKDPEFESKHPRKSQGDEHGGEFTKKYDDSPKATGERIKEALKTSTEGMSLHELAKHVGMPAGEEHDPLSSPLNRALVALRDAGEIETVESESGKGDARFRPKRQTPGKRQPPGSQLPEELRDKLRSLGMVGTFPPAGVPMEAINVANLDLSPEELRFQALMSWSQTTKSGRVSRQYRYTQDFHDRNAAQKFERITAIEPHAAKIAEGLVSVMADSSAPPRDRAAAAIASVIMETGLRPTDSKESIEHGHFGIASIQSRHCTVKGSEIHLDFIGKEGVRNQTVIRDPSNVRFMKTLLRDASPEDSVFRDATSDHAGDMLKSVSSSVGGPEDIKIKDLRTLKATQTAKEVASKYDGPPPPLTGNPTKDKKSIAKAILAMSSEVAMVLNNTPTQARDNYIHPEVFRQWLSKLPKSA